MQSPFQIGERIGGKYRIDSVIGEGGMGIVFGATHLGLGANVAVKVLRGGMGDERTTARFLREARLVARLRSAHAVRVHDIGIEQGLPYIVMERLEGVTLRAALRAGAMPTSTVVDHVIDVCIALAEGHALGIVHRDVKPSNVFLERRAGGETRARLVDFGIARPHVGEATLTDNDTAIGTPQYMAPEQIRDARRVDGRADIWSLGVVLYEALSGALPFEAYAATGYLACVLSDPVTPLARRLPSVPGPLSAIVSRCLEKNPANRVATAAALANLLAPFGGPEAGARASEASRVAAEAAGRGDESKTAPPPAAEARIREPTTGSERHWSSESSQDPPPSPRSLSTGWWVGGGALGILSLAYAFVHLGDVPTAPRSAASADPSAVRSETPPAVSSAELPAATPPTTPSTSASARPPPRQAAPSPAKSGRASSEIEITDWGSRK